MNLDARWFPDGWATRRGGAAAWVLVLLVVVGAVALLVWRARAGARDADLPAQSAPSGRRTPGRGDGPGAGGAATPGSAASVTGDFEGCPLAGDGGDPELNRLKNRSFEGAYAPAALADLLTLSWPTGVGGRPRRGWPTAAMARVAREETRAVSVEGYLVTARTSGPEATNCHGDVPRYRDYHLWLTEAPAQGRQRSLIVEMTPRIRAAHANWNLDVLNRVVASGDRVRASGWLLLDQEHPDQIGKTRGTLWEVHPVTRFEVQRGGRWFSLDDVSFARRARGQR